MDEDLDEGINFPSNQEKTTSAKNEKEKITHKQPKEVKAKANHPPEGRTKKARNAHEMLDFEDNGLYFQVDLGDQDTVSSQESDLDYEDDISETNSSPGGNISPSSTPSPVKKAGGKTGNGKLYRPNWKCSQYLSAQFYIVLQNNEYHWHLTCTTKLLSEYHIYFME